VVWSSGKIAHQLRLAAVSEHGIFHGITTWQENKPLNIRDKNGLFTIEWE
jgi:hypothetical protein